MSIHSTSEEEEFTTEAQRSQRRFFEGKKRRINHKGTKITKRTKKIRKRKEEENPNALYLTSP
jgi:hypothetical protein